LNKKARGIRARSIGPPFGPFSFWGTNYFDGEKRDVAQNHQKMTTKGSSRPHLKFSGASNAFSNSPLSLSLAEDISSLLLCPLHHSKHDFSLREKIENLKKGLEKGNRNG